MSNGFDMVNRILREFVQPPLMNALYISQLLQQMLAGYPNVIYIKASQLPERLLVHVQCDLYQARCCALTDGRSGDNTEATRDFISHNEWNPQDQQTYQPTWKPP